MSFEQFRQSRTVTQRPGSMSNGYWVAGAEVPVTITASVQPANDKQRKNVPEGFDVDSALEIGTDTQLYIAERNKSPDQGNNWRKSDLLTYEGQKYEVVRLERWQNAVIPHYWYIIALPDNE